MGETASLGGFHVIPALVVQAGATRMTANPIIRPVTPRDLEALADLNGALVRAAEGVATGLGVPSPSVAAMAENDKAGRAYLAMDFRGSRSEPRRFRRER